MIKEMNWGTKLMIGMALFMSFILVLAILMFNSKNDALVDNDYYEKGLNYDADYIRKEQVKKDQAAPELVISANLITLKFKNPGIGTIKLIRNSDNRMDRLTAFKTDENNAATLPIENLARGRWKLIVSWKSDGKSYLDEQEITIE